MDLKLEQLVTAFTKIKVNDILKNKCQRPKSSNNKQSTFLTKGTALYVIVMELELPKMRNILKHQQVILMPMF